MIHQLSDGTPLYYEVQGKADAPSTIVFLNGLSQSTAAWTGIAPAFYADYRVVLLDFVFQGQSGAPENFRTYDQHAADVTELLRAIGVTNAVLCGISYGSGVAQHALVNAPGFYKGAVLLSTFAHATPLFNELGKSWEAALRAGGYPLMLEVMLPAVLGRSYFENPLIPIETMKESRLARNLSTDSLLKLMCATGERGDYREKLKAIDVPVLVVQGEEDFLIPPDVAKEVAKHIPGAKFEVLPRVGHTLNLEAIPQVIQLLKEFLR